MSETQPKSRLWRVTFEVALTDSQSYELLEVDERTTSKTDDLVSLARLAKDWISIEPIDDLPEWMQRHLGTYELPLDHDGGVPF